MKSKVFLFITLILVGILFGVSGCDNFLNANNRATVTFNLDLSKIVKTSRNETSQNSEYILKVFAYNATGYKSGKEIENLVLLSQIEKKVGINGQVKASLEIEIGLNVIFVGKLYEIGGVKPIYSGNSEVVKIKATDNKVNLVLSKDTTDLEIDVGIEEHEHDFTNGICSCGKVLVPEMVFVEGCTIEGSLPSWLPVDVTDDYKGVFIEGRTVTLSDFYMGKNEVTQEEYASIMEGQKVTVDGKEYELESNPSYCTADSTLYTLFNGDVQEKRPVEGVTWYDSVWYCNALSEKEGLTKAYNIEVTEVDQIIGKTGYYIYSANVTLNKNANGYRLPTEAEWEFAARGGDQTEEDWNYVFSGADTAEGVSYNSQKNAGLDRVGWYKYNSINGTTGDISPSRGEQGYGTHQVGKKAPNRLGLYDMSGNVYEWCYDWYGTVSAETESDPTGASSGSYRIRRGGSWSSQACSAPVSVRNYCSPIALDNDFGFRVVRSAVAKEKELTFTVTFDTLGGSSVEKQEVEKDKTVTEPAEPTKEGYVFGGWYTSSNEGTTLDTKFDFTTPITSNLTLYAKWIQGTDTAYVVQHYKQNLEDDNYTLDVSENKTGTTDTMTSSTPKVYEGFTYQDFEEQTILANGSTVVKIYYDRNIYTVSFSNDGVISETQSVKYEKVATEPTNPTKEGYIFFGWYTSTDGGNTLSTKFNFTTEITNNLTLYAKWETNFTSIFDSITVTTDDTCVILSNSNYSNETSVYDSYVVSEISYPIEADKNYKISVDIKLNSEIEVMLDFCDSLHDNIDLKKSITVGTEWQTIELETGTWQGDWNGSFKLYTGTIEKIYLKNFKIETLETSILPVAVYHSSISNRFEDGFTIEIDDKDGWIAIGGQKAEYGNIYRIDFDLLATDDVKINCGGKISKNYAETGACHQISANVEKHFTLFIPHMGSDSEQDFDFISLGFWELKPTTITIYNFSMKIAGETDLDQIDPVYLILDWNDVPINLTPCENGESFKTHDFEPGECVINEDNGPFVMTQENMTSNSFVWDGNYIDSRTIIKNDNSTNYELILDNEGLRHYVKNVSNETIRCKFWINKLYQLVVEEVPID